MLGLPRSTEFNRRIPKQKFYENLSVTPALRREFVDKIKAVYWRNKIAATTMNLAAGERDERRKKLEKKIAALQAKIRKEKQFNKQVEMGTELKKLKRELGEI